MTDDEDIVAFLTDRIARAKLAIEQEDLSDAEELLDVACEHGTYWCRECEKCNCSLLYDIYKEYKEKR